MVALPLIYAMRLTFKVRLYVAGDASNSTQAVANLQALCRNHIAGRSAIEIIDVLRQPKRALADGVYLTPTLVKLAPKPVCKIVGTLNEPTSLFPALGLKVPSA